VVGVRVLRNSLGLAVLLSVGLLSVGSAHHSILPFDTTRFEELDGVVSEVRWVNPHVRFQLLVKNASGEEVEWDIEGDSANATARQGFSGNSVNVGDEIRVAGFPSARGRQELFVINILIDSEETILTDESFPLRWTEEAAEAVAGTSSDSGLGRSIFRVWGFGELYQKRKSFVYTAAAQASRAAWDPQTDMLAIRCIAPGMPNAILNPYPIEFIDERDRIILRIEEWEATRVIDMVSDEIPSDAPVSLLGYSIGHWDDGALVIETAKVDFSYLDDAGTPMSEDARMVERFKVSGDGSRLDYEVAVTDPQNLVEPAIWDAYWSRIPNLEIRPFECDPE